MKPSTDLFLLIHSLTKSEKGYFKKFAERHKKEGNNYLKLFDAINAQATYDESAIEKKFKKEAFIKQLPFYKNYLYNLILKSLVAYNTDNTPSARISELIRRAEVLITKGMVVQANKGLKEAKVLAEKHEKFYLLLEITTLQRQIKHKVEPSFSKVVEKNHIIYDEQKVILEKIKLILENSNQLTYMDTYAFCNNAEIQSKYRVTESIANEIARKMEADKDNPYNSFESVRYFYAVLTLYYSAVRNEGEKYNCFTKKLIAHYDANPQQLKERLGLYIDELFNYTHSALNVGNIRDFKEARAKVMALQHLPEIVSNDFLKLKPIVIVIHSNLNFYYRTCQFEKVSGIIEELAQKDILEKIGPESDLVYGKYFYFIRTHIRYFVGCLLFYCEDYAKSLKWLSSIWNNKGDKSTADEVYYSAIISLICHFERKDGNSVKYLSKTLMKYVNWKDKHEEFGKVFCSFLIKAVDCKTKAEQVEVFKKMKNALVPFQGIIKGFYTFDLLLWIESKIQGKTTALVMKEHMKVQE